MGKVNNYVPRFTPTRIETLDGKTHFKFYLKRVHELCKDVVFLVVEFNYKQFETKPAFYKPCNYSQMFAELVNKHRAELPNSVVETIETIFNNLKIYD